MAKRVVTAGSDFRMPWILMGGSWFAFTFIAATPLGAEVPEQRHLFGNIAVGETVKHTFSVANEGRKQIAVLSVSSSCSCLTVPSKPANIRTGARGEFEAVFKADKVGRYDARIAVETDDPDAPVRVFRVRAQVLASRAEVEIARKRSEVADAAREALVISPAEAQELLRSDASALAVDTREWRAFSAYRIAGSRNYDGTTLMARRHLSDRRILLVGHGWDEAELVHTALELKGRGFTDVRILGGGLRGWIQAGFPIVAGGPNAALASALVPASDLSPEGVGRGWLFVVAGRRDPGLIGAIEASGGTVVDAGVNGDVADILIARSQNAPGTRAILVATENGVGYETIEAAIRGAHLPPVFYLAGGIAAGSGRDVIGAPGERRPTMRLVSRASNGVIAGGAGMVRRAGCGGCR